MITREISVEDLVGMIKKTLDRPIGQNMMSWLQDHGCQLESCVEEEDGRRRGYYRLHAPTEGHVTLFFMTWK